MKKDSIGDAWEAGTAYEEFMGRWSRPLARAFVRWLDAPEAGHWLDVGTGTGALASAVCDLASPASVVGCDPSAPFIDAARRACADPRARFQVGGVGSLPSREAGYDVVASALALNFFPDPLRGVAEQIEVGRPGGRVAAVVWDYSEGMGFLRHFWDAAAAVDASAESLDEGRRFPICRPDPLLRLFESAGAVDVTLEALTIPTLFADFEDYWRPLLGGTGPAPSFVATLPPDRKESLRSRLMEAMGVEAREPIRLTARAWAVAGRVA